MAPKIRRSAASERSLATAKDNALAQAKLYGRRFKVVQTPKGYVYVTPADRVADLFKEPDKLIIHFDTGGEDKAS